VGVSLAALVLLPAASTAQTRASEAAVVRVTVVAAVPTIDVDALRAAWCCAGGSPQEGLAVLREAADRTFVTGSTPAGPEPASGPDAVIFGSAPRQEPVLSVRVVRGPASAPSLRQDAPPTELPGSGPDAGTVGARVVIVRIET
jgi:hypothetical protein